MVEPLDVNFKPGKEYIVIPLFHSKFVCKLLDSLSIEYNKIFNGDEKDEIHSDE
jgi:hypothetical protein